MADMATRNGNDLTDWARRPGWTSVPLDLDERIVVAFATPLADLEDHWRAELEPVEFGRFRDLGFVTGLEQHRGIYDPLLPVTTWAAVGWAPTGQVLSVCRMMRSWPGLDLPVLAAVDDGSMAVESVPALHAARHVPGATVEATIATVASADRPADLPKPTLVCQGLFVAAIAAFGCRWILSAVDPGALEHAHAKAPGAERIRTVGHGCDTAGIESLVVTLDVGDVVRGLTDGAPDLLASAMRATRQLLGGAEPMVA